MGDNHIPLQYNMEENIAISIRHVSKSFPGVCALNDVSVDIFKGEVHCLVGENGAGKSTLIKILTGAIDHNCGDIFIDDCRVQVFTPHEMVKLGVAAVYQELNVIKHLSVADNIMLGRESNTAGFENKSINNEKVWPYLSEIDLQIDPRTLLGELSPAEQQMVVIAKALSLNAKVIIFDEPTAMLTAKETDKLFELINMLKTKGVTIIYISHRMKEIFEIGDRVTVLKDGMKIITSRISDISENMLITSMVGREIKNIFPRVDRVIGESILEVKNLKNGKLNNISFNLHRGEVVGISGLVGSGRTELLRALFGADKVLSGEIKVRGQTVSISSPQRAVREKIGLVPEDRRNQGVVTKLSIKENITQIFSRYVQVLGFRRLKKENQTVKAHMRQLKIKAPSEDYMVSNLSGGNQQKVALAKWLSVGPDILLLDEPTQGIDVGSKSEIYELINQLAGSGMGIILVSSEMIEVINLCDTIYVMRKGGIIAQLSKAEANEESIIKYALGV